MDDSKVADINRLPQHLEGRLHSDHLSLREAWRYAAKQSTPVDRHWTRLHLATCGDCPVLVRTLEEAINNNNS